MDSDRDCETGSASAGDPSAGVPRFPRGRTHAEPTRPGSPWEQRPPRVGHEARGWVGPAAATSKLKARHQIHSVQDA